MRQIVLLGNPDTKRTVYLKKGMDEAGVPFQFLDWNLWRKPGETAAISERVFAEHETFLKIDPPLWKDCCLTRLNRLTEEYERELEELSQLGERQKVSFFNGPRDIRQLLDKRECKRKLKESGVSVTEELEEKIHDGEQLLKAMGEKQISQVFLKPVKGSGAAGAAAFRYQRKTGQMVLYTCAAKDRETGRLVNTKRLMQFTDERQVRSMLDGLLGLDCIVERWYAKAKHLGFSYDLRVVVQKGKTDFLLARLSKGPITNLHLNNHPLCIWDLGLPQRVLKETEELGRKAAACYGGLRSVGIDILLEKNSLKPRVIEMNGQGDLIYQDIFHENKIYRHQAEIMREWLYGKS